MLLLTVLLVNVAFGAGYYCNFDKPCGSQSRDDKFDWSVRKTDTPSGGTGPSRGVGPGKGYYAYIEASSPRRPGDQAKLEIRPPLGNGPTCITFYYHMKGKDIGQLIVSVNGKLQFRKSGSQGDTWKKADLKVQERANVVVFEGVRGNGWQGDIAIDEIKIVNCGGGGQGGEEGGGGGGEEGGQGGGGTEGGGGGIGGCGIRPSGTRIVGGSSAKHGEWPWQAMLRTNSGYPYCGGTLVAPQWVVTATHCVQGKSGGSVFVRLGAHMRLEDVGTEQDFVASKVFTHPSYHTPKGYSHDIALLKLERPALLGSYVNLACLPHKVDAPVDGQNCWITGWGRLAAGGSTPEYLQQVSVPVVSRERCEKAYPNKIHDSMICAGLDQGGIDSCQGDSGGPMVCEEGGKYYLQGATSWGYGCADAGKFGVYAKVKYLLPWLISVMSNN